MKDFLLGCFNVGLRIISIIPFNAVRSFLYRPFFKHIGSKPSFLMKIDVRKPKNISVGNNTVIGRRAVLDGRGGELIIGDNVDIAQEVNIWTLEHDVNDANHSAKGGNVEIGDHVWIASRAPILPGVKIGRGAVVASGAVVCRDVPEKAIVGGIPAKVIGQRNNELTYTLTHRPWFQ